MDANPVIVGGIIAGILALATTHKQRLGDMVANTYVVKVKDSRKHQRKEHSFSSAEDIMRYEDY